MTVIPRELPVGHHREFPISVYMVTRQQSPSHGDAKSCISESKPMYSVMCIVGA